MDLLERIFPWIGVHYTQKALYGQIRQYCLWRAQYFPLAAISDYENLSEFARFCHRPTLEDVSIEDMVDYITMLSNKAGSRYWIDRPIRSVCNCLRYFRVRECPCLHEDWIKKSVQSVLNTVNLISKYEKSSW